MHSKDKEDFKKFIYESTSFNPHIVFCPYPDRHVDHRLVFDSVMVATIALISATFFIIGSSRSLLISQKWYISGFEMLILGGVASSVAYFIGFYLKMIWKTVFPNIGGTETVRQKKWE